MHTASLFQINPSAPTPVFQQLAEQVQRLIARGELKPGDLLPSTRDIGRAFAINPMTVSKAYAQLEAQGFLLRKKGVGMSVVDSPAQDKHDLLRPALDELILQAKQLGLNLTDTKALLTTDWKQQKGSKDE